jgi:hypothetical protein
MAIEDELRAKFCFPHDGLSIEPARNETILSGGIHIDDFSSMTETEIKEEGHTMYRCMHVLPRPRASSFDRRIRYKDCSSLAQMIERTLVLCGSSVL